MKEIYKDSVLVDSYDCAQFETIATVHKDDAKGDYCWNIKRETYWTVLRNTDTETLLTGTSTTKRGAIIACREAFLKQIRRM
jgi:hypothetical protein